MKVIRRFYLQRSFRLAVGCGLGGVALLTIEQVRDLSKLRKSMAGIYSRYTVESSSRKPKVAVNSIFWRRYRYIMSIAVPSIFSREAFILGSQTFILISRSLLSIRMARIGGEALKSVIDRSWNMFFTVCMDFIITGVVAATVNSSLKYLMHLLHVYCRQRLTHYVHNKYLADQNYYKTSVLMQGNEEIGGEPLDNADQRIVQDLDDFCLVSADLFQRTFKPLLDVILCTRKLAQATGYSGPLGLYGYFFFAGSALRVVMPGMAKLITQEKMLEGNFRRSHARLIAHAEEVAFLGGAEREKDILNGELSQLAYHKRRMHFKMFIQGVYVREYVRASMYVNGWYGGITRFVDGFLLGHLMHLRFGTRPRYFRSVYHEILCVADRLSNPRTAILVRKRDISRRGCCQVQLTLYLPSNNSRMAFMTGKKTKSKPNFCLLQVSVQRRPDADRKFILVRPHHGV